MYIGTVYIFCTSLWQARAIEIREIEIREIEIREIEIREIGIREIARLRFLKV